MFAGLSDPLRGLRSNDLLMDFYGARLSADAAVPFAQALESPSSSLNAPVLVPSRGEDGPLPSPVRERTSFDQLPGLLAPNSLSALNGDLAGDMGQFLIAKAAYQVNARVFSAEAHKIKTVTQLGE